MTTSPEWLELAQRAVSSRRRSSEQSRVAAFYAEHGAGRYTEADIAKAVGVNFKTVRRVNERLERAGLLVRERLAKDAGAGYFYSLAVPLVKVEDRMVMRSSECGGSLEQAIASNVEDRTVEPNRECGGSAPLTYVLATTSSVVEAAKGSLSTSERERDHAQIVKRLGPISESAFAALNAALDADRLGVIECVHEIEHRTSEGRVTNPVGLLVTMLREGEHIGKRPAPKICVYCGRPQPTARLRRSGHVLCDHHHAQTTDGLLELAQSDHIATTGGVR